MWIVCITILKKKNNIDNLTEFKNIIKTNAHTAASYASIINKAWPEAETIIATDKDASLQYVANLKLSSFVAAENLLSESITHSYSYAKLTKKRFIKGEKIIKTSKKYTSLYNKLFNTNL